MLNQGLCPSLILGTIIETVTLVYVCGALQQQPQEHGTMSLLETTLNSILSHSSHHLITSDFIIFSNDCHRIKVGSLSELKDELAKVSSWKKWKKSLPK